MHHNLSLAHLCVLAFSAVTYAHLERSVVIILFPWSHWTALCPLAPLTISFNCTASFLWFAVLFWVPLSPVSSGVLRWYILEPIQRVWNMHLFVRTTCAHPLHCHTNGTWGYLWVFANTTMAPAASDDCFSGTNVWVFANFLKYNADKIELL